MIVVTRRRYRLSNLQEDLTVRLAGTQGLSNNGQGKRLRKNYENWLKVAFLLTKLNADFATGNNISRSIYDCNSNNPHTEVNRRDWKPKLFLDFRSI